MHALVTGATGLIGAAIVDILLERGHRVRALVRPSANIDSLLVKSVDLVVGDLGDEEGLRQAVQDVDVVFHAAAVLGFRANAAQLDDVNVGGTERLLRACQAARVGRLVHISSVAVYGPHEPPVLETTPKQPNNPYGRSKQAAEDAVWHAYAQGLPVTVLRPCVVYGPGDRYFTPMLAQLMRLPVIPLPDHGETLVELVYVSDVAEAALLAATRAKAVGQAYNITDGRATSFRDVVETYGLLTGQAPRIVDLNLHRLTQAAGLVREAITPLSPRLAHVLKPETLANLAHDIHYDITKAQRDLGYTPRVGLYEGLRRALEAHNPDLLNRRHQANLPLIVGGAAVLAGLVGVVLVRRAVRRRMRENTDDRMNGSEKN